MFHQSPRESEWRTVYGLTTLIFVVTLVPAPVHDPPRETPYHLDKALHFVLHWYFTVALVRALEADSGFDDAALSALVASIGYGIVLEHLQERVPGRRYETGDVVAGTLGTVGGIAATRWLTERVAVEDDDADQWTAIPIQLSPLR